MSTWYKADTEDALERVAVEWPDAPFEREETIEFLLDTAAAQVIAYAQGVPEDATLDDYVLKDEQGEEVTDIPARLVGAQLMQAKDLWTAGRANPSGDLGAEGFTFTPRPLSREIQRVIRPKGIPSVV